MLHEISYKFAEVSKITNRFYYLLGEPTLKWQIWISVALTRVFIAPISQLVVTETNVDFKFESYC